MESEIQLKWFAARIIREKSYVLKYVDSLHVEHAGIADIRTLIFIHTTDIAIERLRSELYDRVLFYRNADRTAVQPIPDKVMKSFLIMAPYHEKPVMYLPIDDPVFLQGKRKRVTRGLFAGCEGVIRRIKGERRLVVAINDHAAIATSYIPREYLEDIE